MYEYRQKPCRLPAKQSVLARQQVNLAVSLWLFCSTTLTIWGFKTLKTVCRRVLNATSRRVFSIPKQGFHVLANVQESVSGSVSMILLLQRRRIDLCNKKMCKWTCRQPARAFTHYFRVYSLMYPKWNCSWFTQCVATLYPGLCVFALSARQT